MKQTHVSFFKKGCKVNKNVNKINLTKLPQGWDCGSKMGFLTLYY